MMTVNCPYSFLYVFVNDCGPVTNLRPIQGVPCLRPTVTVWLWQPCDPIRMVSEKGFSNGWHIRELNGTAAKHHYQNQVPYWSKCILV